MTVESSCHPINLCDSANSVLDLVNIGYQDTGSKGRSNTIGSFGSGYGNRDKDLVKYFSSECGNGDKEYDGRLIYYGPSLAETALSRYTLHQYDTPNYGN